VVILLTVNTCIKYIGNYETDELHCKSLVSLPLLGIRVPVSLHALKESDNYTFSVPNPD
jgi:hypothetical protein